MELEIWLSAGRMLVWYAQNPGFEPSTVELSVVAYTHYHRHGTSLCQIRVSQTKTNKQTKNT